MKITVFFQLGGQTHVNHKVKVPSCTKDGLTCSNIRSAVCPRKCSCDNTCHQHAGMLSVDGSINVSEESTKLLRVDCV
jgi:hypothetical protein